MSSPMQPGPWGPPPEQPGGPYGAPAQQPYAPPVYPGQPPYGYAGPPPGAYSPSYPAGSQPVVINGQAYQPAGMGTRLLARLIDGVLFTIILVAITVIGVLAFGSMINFDSPSEEQEVFMILSFYGIMALLGLAALLYEVGFIAVKGATLGKMAMGIRVVSEQHAGPIGWGMSFVRYIVPALAGSVCCGIPGLLVFISPVWDDTGRNQGWHDKLAKDFVVQVR